MIRTVVFLLSVVSAPSAFHGGQPNIVWVIADDLSQDLGCYGAPAVETPNCDRLAAEATRFTNAFSTAPVCSPSRSALITGCYQTSIGCQHHRTITKRPLPGDVRPVTELFRRAGYRVYNANASMRGWGKTDYNFQTPPGGLFDGHDWGRAEGAPFFAQVQIYAPHRPFVGANKDPDRPKRVRIPGFLPEHPVSRVDYADYLAAVEKMDAAVGRVLRRLETDGIEQKTVVFFFGDHGRPMPRCKQWLYDGGLRVPLLIRDPTGRFRAGAVDDRHVSLIDVTATSLALAGIETPDWMHGVSFADPSFAGREAIFAARDRMGPAPDRVRSVQRDGFKLIRNYHPSRPYAYGRYENAYILEHHPTHTVLKALGETGRLSPSQAAYVADSRPDYELYDLTADPDEMENLADSPTHAARLQELKSALDAWVESTGDRGGEPDPDEATAASSSRKKIQRLRGERGGRPEEMLEYWKRRYGLALSDEAGHEGQRFESQF